MQPLCDKVYTEAKFDTLVFSAAQVKQLTNTTFFNCVVDPGTCRVEADSLLQNIVFDNLKCGDALRISSDANIKQVTIRGSEPKSLIVRPDSLMNATRSECLVLDIYDYKGEVEIIGFGKDAVRFNKLYHVAISSIDFDSVDWKSLDIGPFSYWRIFHKKLKVFQASFGVFSLPSKRDRHYHATLSEMGKLEQLGLVFG